MRDTIPHTSEIVNSSLKKEMELFGDRLKTPEPEGYIVSVTTSHVVLVGATDETARWAHC